ncbi:ribulose-phosphate 3-epimerase [Candidatus Uzinura diaspidicola str. ASNER]|uniref:Ribulose-phosphate 3-epimerase n=1 Tax=Candidatus Uzinura diaspidicola str. ASNER TaxID=1133592 RepID=L7VJW1_9FLAO|nr:ribulose-phosphate 3-epimerase [Candidatus Uzinura diaspidicola str. ASNER]
MHKKFIAPSLLSANFAELRHDIEWLNNSSADWYHIDIMDGLFVDNISFGIPVIKSIKKYARKPLDIHLMILEPERYIKSFKDAGADFLSIHYETCIHLHNTILEIRSFGMKTGVVLNPHTPVSLLKDIITDIDLLVLMSVNPGFGGKSFIKNTWKKLRDAYCLVREKNTATLISIDGGVDLQNAYGLFKSGADVLVVGTAIFSTSDNMKVIKTMK